MLSVWLVLLVCIVLTAIGARQDIKTRTIPPWLYALAFFFQVLTGYLALGVNYTLVIGLGWLGICSALALIVMRYKNPPLGEADLLWLGLIGGTLGFPPLFLGLLAFSCLFAVLLWTLCIWREGMPFLVPVVLALILELVLVLI